MSSSSARVPPTKKKCGPHLELSSNAAARVMRCGCGTVHVHLHAQGISMRLEPDALRALSNALGAASRLVDIGDAPITGVTDGSVN